MAGNTVYLFELRSVDANGNRSLGVYSDYLAAYGTSGDDVMVGSREDDWIIGLAGDDKIYGRAGADKLFGNAGNDVLDSGHNGGSELHGGDGDDTMIAGGNPDTFDGGAGTDTASYWTAGDITIDLDNLTLNTGYAEGDTYANIEKILGSPNGNDTLRGDANNNDLGGFDGDDTLVGRGGDDTLSGGQGDDDLSGGVGADTLDGNTGDDLLEGGVGADNINGGEGIDTVTYISSHAGVTVNISDTNTETGGHANGDTLSNIENIIGTGSADVITGDGHDNVIEPRGAADTVDAGGGNDTIAYTSSHAGVTVKLFDSSTETGGHAQGDDLSNFENIIGSAHADVLSGTGGDNVIEGLAGADTMNGRNGNDTASYASSDAAVTVKFWNSTTTGGHAQGDTLTNFWNLTGSDHDDTLEGDGNSNILEGGAGADAIDGRGGSDGASYASSNAGVNVNLNDSLPETGGHAQADTLTDIESLVGSEHDDILAGDTGNNTMLGRGGTDTFRFFLGFGNDTITDYAANEPIFVCIDGAQQSGSLDGGSWVIAVTDAGGDSQGQIKLTGITSAADVNVTVRSPGHADCGGAVEETFRAWWAGETPRFADNRLFMRVDTNIPAAATCKSEPGQSPTTVPSFINCPPGTFVSLSPYNHADGTEFTVTAVATRGGGATASPFAQVFHKGGHEPPETVVSGGNGRIGVAWEPGGPMGADADINGGVVEHRPLGQSTWTSSGVLAAVGTHSRTLTGLANRITYEVRVRHRNNANDTDANTHWLGPWSYDTVTTLAANSAVPGEIPALGTSVGGSGDLTLTLQHPSDEGAAIHYYTIRHKVTSAADSTYVEQTLLINRSFPGQNRSFDLTPGTGYTFQVRAHNANGAGPWKETTRTVQ